MLVVIKLFMLLFHRKTQYGIYILSLYILHSTYLILTDNQVGLGQVMNPLCIFFTATFDVTKHSPLHPTLGNDLMA